MDSPHGFLGVFFLEFWGVLGDGCAQHLRLEISCQCYTRQRPQTSFFFASGL